MKLTYTAVLIICSLLCSNILLSETNLQSTLPFEDSIICSNTYKFDLKGNVNPLTAKQISDYLLNKIGICDVKIDVYAKKITFYVSDEIDLESIKGILKYASHHYLLKDTHTETIEQ